jgi:hypothetical protein
MDDTQRTVGTDIHIAMRFFIQTCNEHKERDEDNVAVKNS